MRHAGSQGRIRQRRSPVGYVPQALHADHAYNAIDMVLLGRSRYLGRFNSPGRKDKAVHGNACMRSGSRPSQTSATIA